LRATRDIGRDKAWDPSVARFILTLFLSGSHAIDVI
jgi:hypothetical protein